MTLLARVRVGMPSSDPRAALYRDGDSYAAMFAAFPASYWAKWTVLTAVELRVRARGAATIAVWRSDPNGGAALVERNPLGANGTFALTIPIDGMDAGGWLWFDFEEGTAGAELLEAGWWAPGDTPRVRTMRPSIGITTLNREEYLLPLLTRIVEAEEVLELIDRVIVTDHGSRRVRDAAGFGALAARLGERLVLCEQANLGGSGGFARGMLEALDAGSDGVILLDDDVELDPESIRRLVRFAEFTTVPTVVGGHMFDMARKTRLHAMSEGIRWRKFFWETNGQARHDFAEASLRETAWLHARAEADYNGWWMCLVPVTLLREIGLAMPYFIKWDDAEYGLRAGRHGYPTVTLPGAGVWHVSWEHKDDTIDWQGFFHARNRLVTALIHSPYPGGGTVLRANFELSVKYLFALEYTAAELRLAAFRAVLEGPDAMHARLATDIRDARSILAASPTSIDAAEWSALRAATPESPLTAEPWEQPGTGRFLLHAARLGLRNLTRTRTDGAPQAWLSPVNARWWHVGRHDRVLVANAEGDGGRLLRRDRARFFRLLRETARLLWTIRRDWDRLSALYRGAQPELTAIESWRRTTGAPRT